MSNTVLHQNKGGPQFKPRNRASLACLRCRTRKVRCDVSQNGQPCMNCHLDEEDCKVTKRSKKWRKCDGNKQLGDRLNGSDLEFIQELQQQQPKSKATPELCPSTTVEHTGKMDNRGVIASSERDTSQALQDNMWTAFESPQIVDCATTDLPRSTSSSPPESYTMIVYSTYPFVSRPNLFHTTVQEVQHLESNGCFKLPVPEIIGQFMRQYFLHVQPMLPMLNERDFWDAFSQPHPHGPKTSALLLVQAMIFAACSTVPCSTLNRLGYSNVRSARAAFYRKAKLIYDAGIELSAVATSQAALLLTFWNPPLRADMKPNTMWLMIAIENARRAHADRYSEISNMLLIDIDKGAQLRRLWWCCIIRDRILPLGLRRSPHITRAHFDFEKNIELGCMDMKAEIRRSKLHGVETQQCLVAVIEHVIRLSVILTDILLLAFPLKDADNAYKLTQSQLQQCQESLSKWHAESPFQAWRGAVAMADATAVLHGTVMYIYYHWAKIVACHLSIRSVGASHLDPSQLSCALEVRKEARKAMIDIVDSLEVLNHLDLADKLPITIAAYVAFPLAVHIFEATCPDVHAAKTDGNSDDKSLFMKRLGTLVKAMKALYAHYDGVEEVVKTIRRIVDYVQVKSKTTHSVETGGDIIQKLSIAMDLEIRVSLAIDWSLSSGRPANGSEFTTYLGEIFCKSPTSSPEVQITPNDTYDTYEASTDDGTCNASETSSPKDADWAITASPRAAENTTPTLTSLFLPFQEQSSEPTELGELTDTGDYTKDTEIERMIDQILNDPDGGHFDNFFLPT